MIRAANQKKGKNHQEPIRTQPKARETAQDPGVIEFTYHSLVESDVKVLRNKTTPVRSQSFEAF